MDPNRYHRPPPGNATRPQYDTHRQDNDIRRWSDNQQEPAVPEYERLQAIHRPQESRRQPHDPNSRYPRDTEPDYDMAQPPYEPRYTEPRRPARNPTTNSYQDAQRAGNAYTQPYNNAVEAFAVPIQNRIAASGPSGQNNLPNSTPRAREDVLDLTGHVRISFAPGYPWLIATSGFVDVFKGDCRRETDSGHGIVDTVVAIKVFRVCTNELQQRRDAVNKILIQEASVWSNLRHANIQPYLGYCSDLAQSVAFISPFCGTSTVLKYINNHPADKAQLVKDIATGLNYLHSQNVIHGDLNGQNVLVNDKGHAVLTDFGRDVVIRVVGYNTTMLAGSVAYMAPELLPQDDENLLFSKSSDVYAFGMLCFEIITNEAPFAYYNARFDWQIMPLILQGKKPILPRRVRGEVPEGMLVVMEACWQSRPDKRPKAGQLVPR